MYDGQAAVDEDDHADQVPVAASGVLLEVLVLPLASVHTPHVPVWPAGVDDVLVDLLGSHEPQVLSPPFGLEVVVDLLGSHDPQVLSPPFGLEVVDGLLGSQLPHVLSSPFGLREVVVVDGLLGSHDPQVLVPTFGLLVVVDLLGSQLAQVVGSAEDQFSHSFLPDLYGQLVWVGAHEVMVTSSVAVKV